MDETCAERFRKAILKRESGPFGTLFSWWLMIGLISTLNLALSPDALLQQWPASLARLVALQVLWVGATRGYALRSWCPLALAVPVAIVGATLAWRVYGPFAADTVFIGWGGALCLDLAMTTWYTRRIHPALG